MNKAEIVVDYARSHGDTGSVEVQCGCLTASIHELTVHLKANKKDFQTRRGLLKKVKQRKRLLEYLKGKSRARYEELIRRLAIKG